jgi:hypothetical protein
MATILTTEVAAVGKEEEDASGAAPASLDHACVERSFRLSAWVPTEAIGRIIGTKGSVIQHIQRETSTRVVSLPALPGAGLWSPVSITGRPSSVRQAYLLIATIAEEEDDVVAEFRCPFLALRAARYGQRGPFVRRLSAEHNVRVFVPEVRTSGRGGRGGDRGGDRDRDGAGRDMSLEGLAEGVWGALGDIIAHFKSEEGQPRQNGEGEGDRPSWRGGEAAGAGAGAPAAASVTPRQVEGSVELLLPLSWHSPCVPTRELITEWEAYDTGHPNVGDRYSIFDAETDYVIRFIGSGAPRFKRNHVKCSAINKRSKSVNCEICMIKLFIPPKKRPSYSYRTKTIDHIVPLDWGGLTEEGNISILCSGCNQCLGAMPKPVLPSRLTIPSKGADMGIPGGTRVKGDSKRERIRTVEQLSNLPEGWENEIRDTYTFQRLLVLSKISAQRDFPALWYSFWTRRTARVDTA